MAQPESQCLRELCQPQCHKGTVWNVLVIQVRFLRSNYCNAFADGHSVKRFFLIPFEWSSLCPEGQTSVLHLTVVQSLRVFFIAQQSVEHLLKLDVDDCSFPPLLSLANTNLKVCSGIPGSRHQCCFNCSTWMMCEFCLRFILFVICNVNVCLSLCSDI